MTAYLYLRVSTEEQVSNLSLDTQEAECRALCARNAWPIAEVFREEGASAKTLERSTLQRLLAQLGKAKGKVTHLVVLRVDRLSRDRDDFYVLRAALRRHGVRIVSVREEIADDSISAMIVETFSVLQAQVDNLIRAGRAKTGMTEAARRGRWVWKAPIGYRHAPHRDGRPVGLELDPEQAPHIARAFELVAGGVTVDAAFRDCTAAGLRNPKGRPIGRQTFHAIFQKPIYAGRLEVTGWGVETASAAPAIVSEETWYRARRAIATRSPERRHTATLDDFPLRGITRCACGKKLAAYHSTGRNGSRWPYYRCQKCAVQIPERRLGEAFERLLTRVAAPEAAVLWVDRLISESLQRRASEMQARLAVGQRRLAAADQRLERLLALRVDGEITPEEFAASRSRLTDERDAARLELAELTTPLDADFGIASSWARRLLTRPAEVWAGLAPSMRAAFVERVFPEGLVFEKGEFANRSKCLLTLPLQPNLGKEEDLVGQPEACSNRPDLFTWCREFRTLEPFARAA